MNHEMISLSNIMYLPSPFLCFLPISAELNILKYRSPGVTPLFKIYQLIFAYVIKVQALQHRAEVFSQWCSHFSSPNSILFLQQKNNLVSILIYSKYWIINLFQVGFSRVYIILFFFFFFFWSIIDWQCCVHFCYVAMWLFFVCLCVRMCMCMCVWDS